MTSNDDQIDKQIKSLAQTGLIEFVDMGRDNLPDGTEVITDYLPAKEAQPGNKVRHTIFTGDQIKSASVSTDKAGKYLISFELDEKGTGSMYDFSKNNTGKYLAITLDKIILTDPSINSPIPDGKAIIEGNFTEESARELAALMRSKALPFALEVMRTSDY